MQSGEAVSPLLVPAIFFGTVLTHLCGGSAGREGAALQMGGSIGYNIAKLFHFPDHDRRTATVCGMAAFFSALFGTPLAATLFAMMVEDVGLSFSVAFVPGFCAALLAYGISLACGIAPTRFALSAVPALGILPVLQVALLGVACAAVTRLFCLLLHVAEHQLPKRLPNPWVRVVLGGVVVVALSYLMGVGRYNGAGMGVITAAVEQGQALPWDFICKILLTAITLASGFKGGEVVPSFISVPPLAARSARCWACPPGFRLPWPWWLSSAVPPTPSSPPCCWPMSCLAGAGLELIALGCGLSYMLSGYHGLYSSQTFLSDKFHSEYTARWEARLRH